MENKHQDIARQLEIIHLSDIHFGNTHRFRIPNSVDGDSPKENGYPTLAEKLKQDLSGIPQNCPVILCMTGDFVDTAKVEEFMETEKFINDLLNHSSLSKVGKENVFIVPGNHDVNYNSEDLGIRFQQYIEFYNRLFGTMVRRDEPQKSQMIFDRSSDLGFIIVCLNSSTFVKKGTQNEKRGRIGIEDLEKLLDGLEKIPKENLKNSIKVALIHHHPILIPALAEPDRGYDAVYNSESLIPILKKFGFHAILHGHKHNPHTFTEDIKPAYRSKDDGPLLIVAGGSIGSKELPSNPNCINSYNKIKIKWHPKGEQTRIRVETRGLKMYDTTGNLMIATRWKWELMNVDDRLFLARNNLPLIAENKDIRSFEDKDKDDELKRVKIYELSRGNLPVINVLPSLEPDQAYEAIVWIVQHPYATVKKEEDLPIKVIYSAGSRFEIVEVTKEQSINFTAKFAYWGPMLIQAKLVFGDGHEFFTNIYAKMPNQY